MKKLLLLIFLPLALMVGCRDDSDAPAAVGESDSASGEMLFKIQALSLTRASSNGIYGGNIDDPMPYPVQNLFLTTYHRDSLGLQQWYFQDLMLKEEADADNNRLWRAYGWYWPMQGEMQFLSYWSPKVYGKPNFYIYEHYDGSKSAQMEVDCTGNTGLGIDQLDGKTDWLYIAENHVRCPRLDPYPLTYKHGLSWITMSLQAQVLKADGTLDADETAALIDLVKIKMVVLEDVSRLGTAYLVPGLDVAWTIDDVDIRDQVYTRPDGLDEATHPRGQYSRYTWFEVEDGRSYNAPDYITLSPEEQHLGLYTPSVNDGTYAGDGLLIIPQHRTAITIYYLIKNGKKLPDGTYEDLYTAERYELRDNAEEWRPGERYHYKILFKSTVDDLSRKVNVDVVETTFKIERSVANPCYDYEDFGEFVIVSSDGTTRTYTPATFILHPYHTQGSPFSDEMDYRDGGQVF